MVLEILIFVAASGVLSLAGGVLLLAKKQWSPHFGEHFVAFAAGVLLTVAFLDLFPEAAHHMEGVGGEIATIFLPAFLAILTFFLLERFLLWFHHHHEFHGIRPSIALIILGDSIHNFIDGVAIAASFLIDRSLGYVMTFAVAAHELPQEMADFSVMIAAKVDRRRIITFNMLSSLAAIVGALVMLSLADQVKTLMPAILAFAAGMFVYIASSDLIPELHRSFSRRASSLQLVFFFLGIGVTVGTITLFHQVIG